MNKKNKKKNGSVVTEHLTLIPMTVEELESLSVYNEDETVKATYKKMAELVSVNPRNAFWYTNWKVMLTDDRTVIGGAGFSGLPNEKKEVKAHCSLLDYYLDKNYGAEVIKALTEVAFRFDNCVTVTVPVMSQSDLGEFASLTLDGYHRELEDDGTISFKIEKKPTYNVAIFSLFGMLFGLGAGLILSSTFLIPTLAGLFCGFVVGMALDISDRKQREDAGLSKKKKKKKDNPDTEEEE